MEGLLNELPRHRKSDDWDEEDADSDSDLEVDESEEEENEPLGRGG